MMQTQQGLSVILCDDLMFTSRIIGTARSLGLPTRVCRTAAELEALAGKERLGCVILDLHHPGLNVAALTAAVKRSGPCTMVGFGSHVAADVLRAARENGCDVVLPRSRFVQDLEAALPQWCGRAEG